MPRHRDTEAWAKHLASHQHICIAAETPIGKPTDAAPPKPSRRLRVGSKSNKLQGLAMLIWQLEVAGAPTPVAEFCFHNTRKWRADLAWPALLLLVEYEGAVYLNGRHTRGAGYEEDCAKYNAATLLGYRLLRFTDRMVNEGRALSDILRIITIQQKDGFRRPEAGDLCIPRSSETESGRRNHP